MTPASNFYTGPWHDVASFLDEVHAFYDENIDPETMGSIEEITKKRIIESRHWQASRMLWEQDMIPLIEELEVVYVPKQLDPGPGILFPQRDYHGNWNHGKFKPFYDLQLRSGSAKYGSLGHREGIAGPSWFGDTDETLCNIARLRSVGIVEGFFDALACRLALPTAPILSNGTKSISERHVHYLSMLGVKNVHLLFDDDPIKEGNNYGEGQQAMEYLKKTWDGFGGMEFHVHKLPANDPSLCLESYDGAKSLRRLLHRIFVL